MDTKHLINNALIQTAYAIGCVDTIKTEIEQNNKISTQTIDNLRDHLDTYIDDLILMKRHCGNE
jgi:ribosomal protein S15P/S13E